MISLRYNASALLLSMLVLAFLSAAPGAAEAVILSSSTATTTTAATTQSTHAQRSILTQSGDQLVFTFDTHWTVQGKVKTPRNSLIVERFTKTKKGAVSRLEIKLGNTVRQLVVSMSPYKARPIESFIKSVSRLTNGDIAVIISGRRLARFDQKAGSEVMQIHDEVIVLDKTGALKKHIDAIPTVTPDVDLFIHDFVWVKDRYVGALKVIAQGKHHERRGGQAVALFSVPVGEGKIETNSFGVVPWRHGAIRKLNVWGDKLVFAYQSDDVKPVQIYVMDDPAKLGVVRSISKLPTTKVISWTQVSGDNLYYESRLVANDRVDVNLSVYNLKSGKNTTLLQWKPVLESRQKGYPSLMTPVGVYKDKLVLLSGEGCDGCVIPKGVDPLEICGCDAINTPHVRLLPTNKSSYIGAASASYLQHGNAKAGGVGNFPNLAKPNSIRFDIARDGLLSSDPVFGNLENSPIFIDEKTGEFTIDVAVEDPKSKTPGTHRIHSLRGTL